MSSISINSSLHIAVPRLEGCWLQADSNGLALSLNFPGITASEMQCFSSGIYQSALYISESHPPIPYLLLEFTAGGFGPVEGSFNARAQYAEYLEHFMNSPSPAKVTMYLTDRGKIKGISYAPLNHEITEHFKQVVREQMATPYTDQEFAMAKAALQQRYTTNQLYAICRAPSRVNHRRAYIS